MRTPDGKDCNFYYEDFHRGRDKQECRAHKAPQSAGWQPKDCEKCPVPAILKANASPHLELEIHIRRGFLGFGNKTTVNAWCKRHDVTIPDPHVGCPKCNEERPGLSLFAEALDDIQ